MLEPSAANVAATAIDLQRRRAAVTASAVAATEAHQPVASFERTLTISLLLGRQLPIEVVIVYLFLG